MMLEQLFASLITHAAHQLGEIVLQQLSEECLKKRNSHPDDHDIILKYEKKLRVIWRYSSLFTYMFIVSSVMKNSAVIRVKVQCSALGSSFEQRKETFSKHKLLYKGSKEHTSIWFTIMIALALHLPSFGDLILNSV